MIDRWLWAAAFASNDEFFYKPKDHEDWKMIEAITEEIILDND